MNTKSPRIFFFFGAFAGALLVMLVSVGMAAGFTGPKSNPSTATSTINASGTSIGIGTATPTTSFEVNGSAQIDSNLTVSGTITGSYSGTATAANISSGQFGGNTGGGNYSFPANVGIATTTPGSLLQVGGGGASGKLLIDTQDNSYGQLQIGNPTSNGEASMAFISGAKTFGGTPSSTNGSGYIWDIGAGNWGIGGSSFGIGNSSYGGDILTIASSGAVGIGGTASLSQERLYVGGASQPYGLYVIGSTAGIFATSTNTGIQGYGSLGYGVYGNGGTYGVYGAGGCCGVYGSGSSYGTRGMGGTYGTWGTGNTYGAFGAGGTYGVYGQINAIANGVGVYGDSNGSAGGKDFAGSGGEYAAGGTWTNASSRSLKENFKPVDDQSILVKIADLPITQWNYKDDKAAIHIGPVAEDFYSLFGLGDNSTSISTIDPAGVALVGIKALDQNAQSQQQEIDQLKTENAALKAWACAQPNKPSSICN